ncbi:MAG: chorismate synthase, partial [Bdellovibrionales bacterium]
MNNTFGRYFSMRSFGESHGPALGVVVDGCPAGVKWDQDLLLNSLARRRPGQSSLVSARQEGDQPEVLSGVYEGQTLGTPIAIMVRNHDARPEDYAQIAKQPRLGHADDVWRDKFGHADPRGGGRSSGRETVARVMAGAVAQMFCQQLHPEIRTISFARQIGPIAMTAEDIQQAQESLLHKNYWMDQFAARLPHEQKAQAVEQLLNLAKQEGKSYGGVAQTWIKGVPRGLGQPVFHKLKNDLAAAVM